MTSRPAVRTDRTATAARLVGTALVVTVLVTSFLYAPHARAATGQAGTSLDKRQTACQPPVTLRETAHARLEALRRVDNDSLVAVPDGTIDAVARQVADGDASYDVRQHCDARQAYQTAINQSTVALKDAYRAGARRHLNATAAMIEAERADGNPNPAAGDLAADVAQQRRELQTADSLAALRRAYRDAVELHDRARDRLPTGPLEVASEAISEQPLLAGYAAVVTAFAGILLTMLWVWMRDSNTPSSHTTR